MTVAGDSGKLWCVLCAEWFIIMDDYAGDGGSAINCGCGAHHVKLMRSNDSYIARYCWTI